MILKRKVIGKNKSIRVFCDNNIKPAIRPCKYCNQYSYIKSYGCGFEKWCFDINMNFAADFGNYKYALQN